MSGDRSEDGGIPAIVWSFWCACGTGKGKNELVGFGSPSGSANGLRCAGSSSASSASNEETISGSSAPSTDGLRPDQSGSLALSSVAHVKGIAISKVRGDIAVIGNRNIGAFFSELDVVAVVSEAMRKQPSSAFFAPGHCSNQHGSPPMRYSRLFYEPRGCPCKW